MISRRGLIVAGAAGVGGLGASQRRPDQHYGAPAPGLVPGSRSGNLRARSLVLFGTGNGVGLFEYNGAPAGPVPGPANPPVAYAASPGVTQDPYGNALPATSGGFVTVGGGLLGELVSAALKFLNPSSPPNSPPTVYTTVAAAAGTKLNVSSGRGTSGAVAVTMTLLDSLGSSQGVAQVVIGPVNNTVAPLTTALLEVQGQISTTGFNKVSAGGDLESIFGNVHVIAAGSGLRVAEGTNAKQGIATLAAGTKLVANTSVTANSRIFLTAQDNNSTGALRVSARVAGTSFTITSSNAADTGVVAYEIFEPG